MRAGTSSQSSVRGIRRSVAWKALKEYVGGAPWVLPPGSPRLAVLDQAAVEALADAERSMSRPPSLERIRAAVKALRIKINSRRSELVDGS